MKKIFLFLAIATTTLIVSCSDDENTTDPNAATLIVLSSNVDAIVLGESVTFTVTDNKAGVVTAAAKIFVNNVAISGATFTPDAAGTFLITATFKNTNNVILESNPLTIAVTAAGENSIFVNGQNYSVENSILIFYGGYAEDEEAATATHGLFSMIAFDGDPNDEEFEPQNYIDIEFIVALAADGTLAFPSSTNTQFLQIYEAQVGGFEIDFTSQEGGTFVNANFPEAVNVPHSFSCTADYNLGSSLEVNFDGNWLGFVDGVSESKTESNRNFVKMSSLSSTKMLSKKDVSKLKVAAKAKVLAKN